MTHSMQVGWRSVLLALAAGVALVACGGGGDSGTGPTTGGGSPAASGTLRLALTDAPRCRIGNDDLDHVFVTVERVRVHESSADDPPASGWRDVEVLDPVTRQPGRKIDLLELTNGRLEELGTLPLPAGTYTQARLVLRANQGSGTPANSLVLAGKTEEIALRTPSAAQSGLKLIHPFTVQPNTLVDVVIDFDACRSIVRLGRGNGGYLLKPVLSAHQRIVAAIRGFVDPAIANVVVSAQKDGAVVRSTVPDSDGQFIIAFLDPAGGPYDVVVTAPARGSSVVGGVLVDSTNSIVNLSTAEQRIPLPLAATPTASRTASGTLGPDAARATGVVRAVQAVGSAVPVVELATDNVDGTTGEYSVTLPVAAPLFAPFATTLPLTFAVPTGPSVDFSYKLEATATGYAKQTQNIGTGTGNPAWNPMLLPAP
jgi:hypothetical protein